MFAWFHGWSTAMVPFDTRKAKDKARARLAELKAKATAFESEGEFGVLNPHRLVHTGFKEAYDLLDQTAEMLTALFTLDSKWSESLHQCQQENARLVEETHRWSEAVKKLEAERDRFQVRVATWMQETFGPEVSADYTERGFRFGEEAIELLQANGTTKEDVLKLVDYVYSRPVGELSQEVGGTMVTLAALCEARGLNLAALANDEQTRVEQPAVRAKIQRKQEDKRARMIATPLPGND